MCTTHPLHPDLLKLSLRLRHVRRPWRPVHLVPDLLVLALLFARLVILIFYARSERTAAAARSRDGFFLTMRDGRGGALLLLLLFAPVDRGGLVAGGKAGRGALRGQGRDGRETHFESSLPLNLSPPGLKAYAEPDDDMIH